MRLYPGAGDTCRSGAYTHGCPSHVPHAEHCTTGRVWCARGRRAVAAVQAALRLLPRRREHCQRGAARCHYAHVPIQRRGGRRNRLSKLINQTSEPFALCPTSCSELRDVFLWQHTLVMAQSELSTSWASRWAELSMNQSIFLQGCTHAVLESVVLSPKP